MNATRTAFERDNAILRAEEAEARVAELEAALTDVTPEQINEAAYALATAYGCTESGPDDGPPRVPGLMFRDLAKIALSATEGPHGADAEKQLRIALDHATQQYVRIAELDARIAELEAALTEALDLADSMELALDQEFGVTGDPPSRDRETIERLSLVLKGSKT